MFLFNFLIGAAILLLLWLGLRWFAYAKPGQVVQALKWSVAVIGGAIAVWLTVTGRLGQAVMLASVMAPMFVRWKALWTRLGNTRGPTPGTSSEVESGWFRMSLDHDTGAMDGVVLQGGHRGRRLSELPADALLTLLADARVDDPESAALLEAYLDRVHPAWRSESDAASGDEAPRTAPSGAMSREEAYRILGLQPGASDEQIRDAHRRLMKSNHPDLGGSDYLAAKINEAKERLLGS
jgi:hypothetical protein